MASYYFTPSLNAGNRQLDDTSDYTNTSKEHGAFLHADISNDFFTKTRLCSVLFYFHSELKRDLKHAQWNKYVRYNVFVLKLSIIILNSHKLNKYYNNITFNQSCLYRTIKNRILH